MRVDEFTNEPQDDDPLQVAGDAALEAIRASLTKAGIAEDEYSVVITLERGEAIATCLHVTGEPDDQAATALETQLMHAAASARSLGLQLRVIPMVGGIG